MLLTLEIFGITWSNHQSTLLSFLNCFPLILAKLSISYGVHLTSKYKTKSFPIMCLSPRLGLHQGPFYPDRNLWGALQVPIFQYYRGRPLGRQL